MGDLGTNMTETQQPPSPKDRDVIPAPDNASEEVDILYVLLFAVMPQQVQ